MLLSALKASREFGAAMAGGLGLTPVAHEEREFEYGEDKARPLVDVRAADAYVYVVQSLHGGQDASANDKLARRLFFGAMLKNHGLGRVTAIVPYLAYAYKDRRARHERSAYVRGTPTRVASSSSCPMRREAGACSARSRIVWCSAGGRALVR